MKRHLLVPALFIISAAIPFPATARPAPAQNTNERCTPTPVADIATAAPTPQRRHAFAGLLHGLAGGLPLLGPIGMAGGALVDVLDSTGARNKPHLATKAAAPCGA